jgi:hypothetical protein
MPASQQSNGRAPLSEAEQGVLSNLPRTRPQRATRGRLAARKAGVTAGEGQAPSRADTATSKERKSQSARGPRARSAGSATAPASTPSDAGGSRTRTRPRTTGRAAGGAAARTGRPVRPQGAGKRKAGASGAATSAATATSKPPRAKRTPRRAATSGAPAPRQGFESEGERASGAVQPPGGAELVASAAEIVGELTRAGFSAGERLLRDVFSRLPGS